MQKPDRNSPDRVFWNRQTLHLDIVAFILTLNRIPTNKIDKSKIKKNNAKINDFDFIWKVCYVFLLIYCFFADLFIYFVVFLIQLILLTVC